MDEPRSQRGAELPTTGLDRRDFLRVSLATLMAASLRLPSPLHRGPRPLWAPDAPAGPARSFVLIYLAGGPSHIDTFDPKPGSPSGGPFKAVKAATKGLSLSEHLPRLAAASRDFALLRSLTSREGNHDRARCLVHTCYPPFPALQPPSLSSTFALRRGEDVPEKARDLPRVVAINGGAPGAGFLDADYAPFVIKRATAPIDNLSYPQGVDASRFARRLRFWRQLVRNYQKRYGGTEGQAHAQAVERAVKFMHAAALQAFDWKQEPEQVRAAYGEGDFAAGCLIARRLVEAGVPAIEVVLDGWDTHQDNFERVRALSAQLDTGLSALLADLKARGLLAGTLVACYGEFGRTPRITADEGRGHHPQAWSALLAGGGIRGGVVHGETDAEGARVVKDPVTVPDFFATLATALGLDPNQENVSPAGRPFKIGGGGKAIRALFA